VPAPAGRRAPRRPRPCRRRWRAHGSAPSPAPPADRLPHPSNSPRTATKPPAIRSHPAAAPGRSERHDDGSAPSPPRPTRRPAGGESGRGGRRTVVAQSQ
jgi:hypothetical protein